ncbi:homer protein homolog 2-like isoform X3 [Haliotis rufescens]|uniref:homer protein homolog 2-like isoform X3 n=1 Tax=Haliotis rufescens TaxID=6454 RepID=UPI001EB05975|nr:homer protein homolog 2-like isoform X3 [Haliotis rufescens]
MKRPREQPIFATKAHVFQIDPETKKNWIPASKTAVSVAYYYDSARDTYRIISVEGTKAIVNSTITPNLTFTKTSQKFGQWSDARANTVYGLGFPTEADLGKFIEKFKEIKDLTRSAVQHQLQSGGCEINGTVDANNSSPPQPSQHRQFLHQRTNSLSSLPQGDVGSLRERRNSFTQGSNNLPQASATEAQLKYENDRLKLALAQSSSNAKKWEVELQTLKNNNARLTAALQESTSNVEEWQKQLAAYREDNSVMKKKVAEMDQKGGGGADDRAEVLEEEVQQVQAQVEQLRGDNSIKDKELGILRQQVEDLSNKETNSTALQARIQNLEEENHSLSLKVQDLQRLLNNTKVNQDTDTRELLSVQNQLGNKITELYELHEQIVSIVKKESTS